MFHMIGYLNNMVTVNTYLLLTDGLKGIHDAMRRSCLALHCL